MSLVEGWRAAVGWARSGEGCNALSWSTFNNAVVTSTQVDIPNVNRYNFRGDEWSVFRL